METPEEYWKRKEVERLDERYNSTRGEIRKVANKIIADWINSMESHIRHEADSKDWTSTIKHNGREIMMKDFTEMIKKSQKLPDKLLRYIIADYRKPRIKLPPFRVAVVHIKDYEMEAMFNEAYATYKRRGKYDSNSKSDRRVKKKNFVEVLLEDILSYRFGRTDLWEKYKNGDIGWEGLLNKLSASNRLLLLWSIFCYGMRTNFKDLILRDDKDGIMKSLDLEVINQNVNNIRSAFRDVFEHRTVTKLFIRNIETYADTDDKRNEFLSDLFSVTKSNNELFRGIIGELST